MKKRSVRISGHPTSISLEDEFWEPLKEIAEKRGISVNHLIQQIDEKRAGRNLSSSIRVFVFHEYCNK